MTKHLLEKMLTSVIAVCSCVGTCQTLWCCIADVPGMERYEAAVASLMEGNGEVATAFGLCNDQIALVYRSVDLVG